MSHAIDVCALCIGGAGGECHTPGCAFWMADAPSGDVLLALRRAAHNAHPDEAMNAPHFDGYRAGEVPS